jgi:hypothetical protein
MISEVGRDTHNPSRISSKTLENQDEMSRTCSKYGGEKKSYRILERKPIGRPKRRLEDNIKIDLRMDDMDLINSAEDRNELRAVMNMVIDLVFLEYFQKFLSRCRTGSFSRRVQFNRVRY